ncbi:MAG: DUF2934 domain-containing protein [Acetobacteraceae bacterium]|jgi:hypothetical protein
MADKDDLIRERAYHIWQERGQQEGFHNDHWYSAEQEHAEAEEAERVEKERSGEPAKKK